MQPGDFVITPSWTWHDHGNETEEPMVWLDGLDIQIVKLLSASFAEQAPADVQAVTRPEGDSSARFGNNLLPVDWKPEVKTSPVFNYPYARTREALDTLRRNGEPGPLSRAQDALRQPGERRLSRCRRSALSFNFCRRALRRALSVDRRHGLCRGRGRAARAGSATRSSRWQPRDIFVVPSWMPVSHHAEAGERAVQLLRPARARKTRALARAARQRLTAQKREDGQHRVDPLGHRLSLACQGALHYRPDPACRWRSHSSRA